MWLAPAGIALAYAVVAASYIVASSAWAAGHSGSVADLQRLETWKGLGFVAVTTFAVYYAARFAGRWAVRDQARQVQQELAVVSRRNQELAGVMAAAVAHDANNVLVSLLAEIDAMVATGQVDGLEATAEQLRSGVDKLVALNGRLLGLPLERSTADVGRVVRDTIGAIRAHAAIAGCRIECAAGASRAETHPLLLHQIVGNLVLNAGEATDGRGHVDVRVFDDPEWVVIEVHDDGPGIPLHRRAALFAGFGSTKPRGAGLGLFSVRACVELLGGTIEVGDSPLGGALFRVRLPRGTPVEA